MIKRIAHSFFRFYCDPDYYPDIQGDLEEIYRDNVRDYGKQRAAWKYCVDVILLFRPSLIRTFGQYSIITTMFSNYFKISFRHLLKHKSYTFINVLGLALGLAGFALIMHYVAFERSYDSFHDNADNLYRLSYLEVIDGNVDVKDAMAAYPVGKLLYDKLPEVESYTITKKQDELTFRYGNATFKEDAVISADSTFLDHFTYRVLMGDPKTMLDDPFNLVLTESTARKYFGDENPIGKTMEVIAPMQYPLKVTGVIEDVPYNTHYRFDIMVSDITLAETFDYNKWNYNNYYAYFHLKEGIDLAAFNLKLADIADEQFEEEGEVNTTYWDMHPVQEIHLTSDFTYEPQIHGSEQAVNFLTVIAAILILIAWVNYINLSTAKAVERAREVGLRKVVGAEHGQLILQFLAEAILINLVGAVIAIAFIEVILPSFNHMLSFEFMKHSWENGMLIMLVFSMAIVGSLLSGFYPAIVMSRYKPVKVLKGKYASSKSGIFLRKALVTLQFVASFVIISSTFIVNRQVNYMRTQNKGMTIDHVITFAVPDPDSDSEEEEEMIRNKHKAFKEEIKNLAYVKQVGGASNIPGGGASDINSTSSMISVPGHIEELRGTTYLQWNDDMFFNVMDNKFLVGQSFDPNMPSDSNKVVINEALLKRLQLPLADSVIGKSYKMWGKEFRIAGVIENYNRTTLKSAIEPTIYMPWDNPTNVIIKLDEQNYQEGLKQIGAVWSEFYTDLPLDYIFMDQLFEKLYYQDVVFGKVFFAFSVIAIIVSMLGLFGLSSFTAIQRTKEMGIRKVLGASFGQISSIFYKDFLWLLLLATLIGMPLLFYIMDGWLNNYAFRISFPWFVPGVSLMIILLSALISIGYQTIKMTRVNPIETLRYE